MAASSIMRTCLIVGLLAALSTGPVLACNPWVEEHHSTAMLRMHTDAVKNCTMDEPAYQEIVSNWLSRRAPSSSTITAIALGRAVNYPWLSRSLADSALSKPQTLTGSQLAQAILQDAVLRERLAIPFANSPYQVDKITYEKVLFGPAGQYASRPSATRRQVPFDAQLWLHLKESP